jgi:glycosyltransferase involved in cell wall biosynthesis
MSLKIAIVVQGRFHAFDLARELLQLGHDVILFTNYPAFVAERFGVPRERVRSFLAHGVGSRILWRAFPRGLNGKVEQLANTLFGKWAASEIMRQDWNAIIGFSGICEESFRLLANRGTVKLLQRASSHIRTQWQLLSEEQSRAGCWIEKPSPWIIAREEREYALADVICVLGGFAYQSFLDRGVPASRLCQFPVGVDTRVFRPSETVIEARCQRILADKPLRVLNVGTFSHRKGARDFLHTIQQLRHGRFIFRFVGPIAKDASELQKQASQYAEFHPKRPQHQLPEAYEWGDIFVLPTIEDGSPYVLNQALASGLPLITSTNCSGSDLISEGETGWLIPIRSPEALVSRLDWCDKHRPELVDMVKHVRKSWQDVDWSVTARQAEGNILLGLSERLASSDVPARFEA